MMHWMVRQKFGSKIYIWYIPRFNPNFNLFVDDDNNDKMMNVNGRNV